MAELTVVKPGQSIADAVKQDIQQSAQAKQLVAIKKQVTEKLTGVLNVLMQSFAVDLDNAASTTLAYAAGLSHGTGISKEDFLKSADKIWEIQVAHHEEILEEQRKMILGAARQLMANKSHIPPQFVGQMQALKCNVPEDLQAYIDAQSKTDDPVNVAVEAIKASASEATN